MYDGRRFFYWFKSKNLQYDKETKKSLIAFGLSACDIADGLIGIRFIPYYRDGIIVVRLVLFLYLPSIAFTFTRQRKEEERAFL